MFGEIAVFVINLMFCLFRSVQSLIKSFGILIRNFAKHFPLYETIELHERETDRVKKQEKLLKKFSSYELREKVQNKPK